MRKTLDKQKIVRAAICKRGESSFEVRSPEYDRVLGAAETEGEAWQLFFELLAEVCDAYHKNELVGHERAAAQMLGRKGGAVRTRAKAKAAVENGKKGGRPRKKAD